MHALRLVLSTLSARKACRPAFTLYRGTETYWTLDAESTEDYCQTWLEGHWHKAPLRSLGLAVHLSHPDSSACPQPQRTVGNFVVIHTNGVHEVKAVFCGCSLKFVPPQTQLLRERWWPATTDKPRTAVTFEALDALDALATSGKTNTYEFWNTMCLLTDATGTQKLPVSCTCARCSCG